MSTGGWISVAERLPDPGVCVLVATDEGYVLLAAREKVVRPVGRRGGPRWVDPNEGLGISSEVLNWQPLPAPPSPEAVLVEQAHAPIFLVEEWEAHEGSTVMQILLDEEEALDLWKKDERRRQSGMSPSHGTQVRRWVFSGDDYRFDETWPPASKRGLS